MTPETGDISVVIPYYNRELYIDETVQSVLAQTLKPLEIIIVNDCSRESSRKYLERYAETCKIVDLPYNVGLAAARNAGIRVARGQFIALLDDDDLWLPDKLEVQLRYMEEHPECFLVHCAVWAFFSNKPDVLWTLFGPGPLTLAQALTDEYWVVPSTMLFRAQAAHAVGDFDAAFRQCEDRDFVIRCCAAGYRIEGIREPLVRLRRESHNRLTRNRWRMFRTDLKMCRKHKDTYLRVYGPRGILSFVLEKLHIATRETRYLDGAVRRLLRLLKVRYNVKDGFQEPVSSSAQVHAPNGGVRRFS
ncbi:MAG: glycosyltransferase family 2 protein [Candidatus Sulfotelmatobacter sp.]